MSNQKRLESAVCSRSDCLRYDCAEGCPPTVEVDVISNAHRADPNAVQRALDTAAAHDEEMRARARTGYAVDRTAPMGPVLGPDVHIRIRCRIPKDEEERIRASNRAIRAGGPGIITGLVPGWLDTELYAVDDDGIEHPIKGVESIEWRAKAGTQLPVAVITFADVDIEVDARLERDPKE